MYAVGVALKRWLADAAALRVSLPDGAKVVPEVWLVTDAAAAGGAPIKIVLDVRIAASEVNAQVPFTCTMTITSSLGPEVVDRVTNLLAQLLNKDPYLVDPSAQIHGIRRTPTRWELKDGLVAAGVIEWAGLASWFPARSAS